MRPPRSPAGRARCAIVGPGVPGIEPKPPTPGPTRRQRPGPGLTPQPTARGAAPATASGSSAAAAARGGDMQQPTVSAAPRRAGAGRGRASGRRRRRRRHSPRAGALPNLQGGHSRGKKFLSPGPAATGSDPEKATETPSPQAVGFRSSTCARGHSWSPRSGFTGRRRPRRGLARAPAHVRRPRGTRGGAARGRREPHPFPRGPEDRVRGAGGRRALARGAGVTPRARLVTGARPSRAWLWVNDRLTEAVRGQNCPHLSVVFFHLFVFHYVLSACGMPGRIPGSGGVLLINRAPALMQIKFHWGGG